ncbi:type II secretion system F family protein [Thalassococcus sp. BH17M4-6]|uniref:type II secretion system F family protein n=1 Tax=Thalassococcus sp. BH17M4-6 TaxID=3413148 RepID=UPI003BE5292C
MTFDQSLFADNALYYVAAFAVVLLMSGGVGFLMLRDRSAMRMRGIAAQRSGPEARSLARTASTAPRGLARALIPDDPSEIAQIQFQLAKVGFHHANAVQHFFMVRLLLAVLPPLLVFGGFALARAGLLPQDMAQVVLDFPRLGLMQIAAVTAAAGFYGPSYLLKSRIKARQQRIRNAFPNALDLLQISVEAGMGLDSAMSRVGSEIHKVSPEIAYELLTLQNEVSAGRDRETAMFDMAERMGVDEAKSFALVIVQSLEFGTSLTSALRTYAAEMREYRELAAQEKANRLPVQMSVVMSFLMLPALFLITLTPIIIRYTAIY